MRIIDELDDGGRFVRRGRGRMEGLWVGDCWEMRLVRGCIVVGLAWKLVGKVRSNRGMSVKAMRERG